MLACQASIVLVELTHALADVEDVDVPPVAGPNAQEARALDGAEDEEAEEAIEAHEGALWQEVDASTSSLGPS